MANFKLKSYQLDAIENMQNGCILCGDVGSGKTLTSIGYYDKNYRKDKTPLYIITTARKRDTKDWDIEITKYDVQMLDEISIKVESWNNMHKYEKVENAFFIFDEQRLVGSGAWVKSFLKIARHNDWILLSATPGDNWLDYIPVFLANGFYKNRTDFMRSHVIFKRFTNFSQVDRYVGTRRLERLRNCILVDMDYHHDIQTIHKTYHTDYDKSDYRKLTKFRQDLETGKPFESPTEFCMALRKLVNSSPDRQLKTVELVQRHKRAVIFYNYDFELNILKCLPYGSEYEVAEWNGHKHQPVPESEHWVYLVQYNAGAEGWNCTSTDTMIFYSNNYSYKIMYQAAGRINRLNTLYSTLYYYHLSSFASIDNAIQKALEQKKKFQESVFFRKEN